LKFSYSETSARKGLFKPQSQLNSESIINELKPYGFYFNNFDDFADAFIFSLSNKDNKVLPEQDEVNRLNEQVRQQYEQEKAKTEGEQYAVQEPSTTPPDVRGIEQPETSQEAGATPSGSEGLYREVTEKPEIAGESQERIKSSWDNRLTLYVRSNRDNAEKSVRTALVATKEATGRKIQQDKQRLDLDVFSESPEIVKLNLDTDKLKAAEYVIEKMGDAALQRRQAQLDMIALSEDLKKMYQADDKNFAIETNNKTGLKTYKVFKDGKEIGRFSETPEKDDLDFEAKQVRDELRSQLVEIGGGKWDVNSLSLHIQPLDTTSVEQMKDKALDKAKLYTTIEDKIKEASDSQKAYNFFDGVINRLKSVFTGLFKEKVADEGLIRAMRNDDKRMYKFRNADNTVMFTLQKGKSDFSELPNSEIKGNTPVEKAKNLNRKKKLLQQIDDLEKKQKVRSTLSAAASKRNDPIVMNTTVRDMLAMGVDNTILQELFDTQKSSKFPKAFRGFEASEYISWQLPVIGKQNTDLDIYSTEQAKRQAQKRFDSKAVNMFKIAGIVEYQKPQPPSEPEGGVTVEAEPKPKLLSGSESIIDTSAKDMTLAGYILVRMPLTAKMLAGKFLDIENPSTDFNNLSKKDKDKWNSAFLNIEYLPFSDTDKQYFKKLKDNYDAIVDIEARNNEIIKNLNNIVTPSGGEAKKALPDGVDKSIYAWENNLENKPNFNTFDIKIAGVKRNALLFTVNGVNFAKGKYGLIVYQPQNEESETAIATKYTGFGLPTVKNKEFGQLLNDYLSKQAEWKTTNSVKGIVYDYSAFKELAKIDSQSGKVDNKDYQQILTIFFEENFTDPESKFEGFNTKTAKGKKLKELGITGTETIKLASKVQSSFMDLVEKMSNNPEKYQWEKDVIPC